MASRRKTTTDETERKVDGDRAIVALMTSNPSGEELREDLAAAGLRPSIATDDDLRRARDLVAWIQLTLETDAQDGDRRVQVQGQELDAGVLWRRLRTAVDCFDDVQPELYWKLAEGLRAVRFGGRCLAGKVGEDPRVRDHLQSEAVEMCIKDLAALDPKFGELDRTFVDEQLRFPPHRTKGGGPPAERRILLRLACAVGALGARETREDVAIQAQRETWKRSFNGPRKKPRKKPRG